MDARCNLLRGDGGFARRRLCVARRGVGAAGDGAGKRCAQIFIGSAGDARRARLARNRVACRVETVAHGFDGDIRQVRVKNAGAGCERCGAVRARGFSGKKRRRVFADRAEYAGDPDFVRVPIDRLIEPAYVARRAAEVKPDGISSVADVRPGLADSRHTTHFSIADKFGNAVSFTYTLNDWFGARVTARGTGVLLNDEMDDFTAKPGVPNMYGLVQGEANRIEPGKRPLSSMTPTIVLRDGKPWMIVGTPGGSRIITAVLHTMLNVIDYGIDIQEAVDAPRIHQQWLPETTFVEARALSPDTAALLTGMGHKLTLPQPENHVAAILIGAPSLAGAPVGRSRFYGALDPRRNTGLALGY